MSLTYLEADSDEMQSRQHDFENYLRQAGNSEEQIKFWMGFYLY